MAHGSPAADLAPPLLALDASVLLASGSSRRTMTLGDYLAPRAKRNGVDALLVEIQFRKSFGTRCGWSFQKLGRTTVDISLVSAAAGLQIDRQGKVKWVRIALGAAAPAAMRAGETEKLIAGRVLDRSLLEEAGQSVQREVAPISDHRASAGYRREMSGVLVRRALEECAAQAGWTL